MAKTSYPLTIVAAPDIAGSSTITPLLSEGNSTTGFTTCLLNASPVTMHPEAGHS